LKLLLSLKNPPCPGHLKKRLTKNAKKKKVSAPPKADSRPTQDIKPEASKDESESTPPDPTPPASNVDEIRFKVIDEIVTTERDYVNSLTILREMYYLPLKALPRLELSNVISPPDLENMFYGFESIYNLNKELLYDLRVETATKGKEAMVGKVLLAFAPSFKLYIAYVNKYDAALKTMTKCKEESKVFENFLTNTALDPICKRRQISDYLIMPIQRIPRYKLLLEELMKRTEESHPDYADLMKCLEEIKQIATLINQKKGEYQKQESVINIQLKFNPKTEAFIRENRLLVLEGQLYVKNHEFKQPSKPIKKKKNKEPVPEELGLSSCTLCLFNDLAVWGVPEKKTGLLAQRGRSRLVDIVAVSPEPSYTVTFYPITFEFKGFSIATEVGVLDVFYSQNHSDIQNWITNFEEQNKEAAEQKVKELERRHTFAKK